tara:strand:+ start:1041 stop:1220 length:180 start_codon:yes stop_codon:yes gene_type:complete
MEAVQAVKRGRPPVENKAQFRNVAVPIDAYNLLRSAAEEEERTIARQLAVLIRKEYGKT